MRISKSEITTLWYENQDGKRYIPMQEELHDGLNPPAGFDYMHSTFPRVLHHQVLRLNRRADGTVQSSTLIFSGESGYPADLVLALVNSGVWDFEQAVLIAAKACERCVNALCHAHGLPDSYAEDSEEYKTSTTRCAFCNQD
jgi:hypothetical protein